MPNPRPQYTAEGAYQAKQAKEETQAYSSQRPVCENAIVEEDKERDIAGDDALICEGKCNAWIHSTCLGLNKQNYQALSESDAPYLCPHCMLNKQAQEIGPGLFSSIFTYYAFEQRSKK